MFPYVGPTVQTPEEIEETQKLDGNFIDLQTKFDKVNDVATEQKKLKKIEDTIETFIDSGRKTIYLTKKIRQKLLKPLKLYSTIFKLFLTIF